MKLPAWRSGATFWEEPPCQWASHAALILQFARFPPKFKFKLLTPFVTQRMVVPIQGTPAF
jgi:hypothetical protein